jgi:D-cysteine desulfhydrase
MRCIVNLLLHLGMFSATARALSSNLPTRALPYSPPSWAQEFLCQVPKYGRLSLANLPTPLYQILLSDKGSFSKVLKDKSLSFYIKRDDATGGVELGGNKIRKLEFLLAEALAEGHDSVVTIGGEQSNHCRATAAAARMVGLEPHLILRSRHADKDLGLVGNLLFDRMVGSNIYTCTPGEYGRLGSDELVARLCSHLQNSKGKQPYPIPVGGSNGLGTWGYIHAVEELMTQWRALASTESTSGGDDSQPSLDHIVFACGSGGTATGIALGIALAHGALGNGSSNPAPPMPHVHAIGVCDDPDYFYNYVAGIADQMGLKLPSDMTTEDFIRQHMTVHQGKGLGYAMATDEELDFVSEFAQATGVVLDPVYSGKALYNFMKLVEEDPKTTGVSPHQNILFWHTGGALGLFEKCDELLPTLKKDTPCQRLDIYGKGDGIDVSGPGSE